MTIRIAANSNNKYQQKEMRTLIVNGTERFRLIVGNKLQYAKGKINFDLNWPKDGSGKSLGDYSGGEYIQRIVPSSFYAFYKDGFYRGSNKDSCQELSQIIENIVSSKYFKGHYAQEFNDGIFTWPLTFKGWYTAKKGGQKINTIEDVNLKTDLFKFKENSTLPEITLYARWDMFMCTIKVHNVSRRGARSSCVYKGKRTDNLLIDTFKVPYKTEIISYINARITSPKYVTWAKKELDGTKKQKALRKGPQKFIGWSVQDYSEWTFYKGQMFLFDSYVIRKKNIDVYPQFQTIVIWKRAKWKDGYVGGTFKLFDYKKRSDSDLWGAITDYGTGGAYDILDWFTVKDSSPSIRPWQYFEGEWPQRVHHSGSWDDDRWRYDSIDIRYYPFSSTIVCSLVDDRTYG